MFRSLHRNVKLRLFGCFLNSLVSCMVFPFMIIYFAQHFGEVCSGIFTATNIVLGAISGFYGGYVSDKLGRRKLLMISALIESTMFLGMAFSNSVIICPIMTLICCSINSIVFGFSAPASQAMILDSTNKEQLKFVYGLQYWLFNLSYLLGGLIGGLLFVDYKWLLMGLLVFGSIVSFLLLKLFIKELYTPNLDKPKKEIIKNYFSIIKDKRFVFFSLGAAFLLSIEFQVRNYIAVKFAKQDELFNYSVLISENAALVILFGLISSYVISKMDVRKAIIFGGILYLVSMSMIAGFSNLWVLILLMGLGTIGELILVPAEQAIIAGLIPVDDRSSYMAVGNAIGRISILMGSFSVSIGYFLTSWQMVCWFLFIGMIGLILIFICNKGNK